MTARETAKNQLQLVEKAMDLPEMMKRAEILVKSKLLPKGVDTPEKALAIMMMGAEYGIPPMKAFQSIHIIEGKPSLSSQLMLALCERTGELEQCKVEPCDTYCRVTLKRRGRDPHTIIFGDEDAKTMKTKAYDDSGTARVIPLIEKYNYKTMKKDMYVARAVSRACRWVFPDAVLGLYVHEEAYDVIDEQTEEKVEAKATVADTAQVKAEEIQAPIEAAAGTVHKAGAEIDVYTKVSSHYIQDPKFASWYPEKTIGEIYQDRTPAGKLKGKEFLIKVASESSKPEDKASIETFLGLLEKEDPTK